MAYACLTWECASDAHLLNLQKRFPRLTGKADRLIPVLEMNMAFRIPYVHNYIVEFCRKHAKAFQNQLNTNVRAIGQEESMHRRLEIRGGKVLDHSGD